MALVIKSMAFGSGERIPKRFTEDGEDFSPALSWTDPPAGTQALALIADDPDAPSGTWVHWVAYNLPGTTRTLPEGVAKTETMAGGGQQGINDFHKTGYGGPCPPPGKPHRYYFKLYALDKQLDLKPGASKEELEKAIEGHTLAKAEIVGKYGR